MTPDSEKMREDTPVIPLAPILDDKNARHDNEAGATPPSIDLGDILSKTKEQSEESIFSGIQRRWNRLSRFTAESLDPTVDAHEKPDMKSAIASEQEYIESIKNRERNGLKIKNRDLERYINAYRAAIYLLSEKYQLNALRKGQAPLSEDVFDTLYTELSDKKDDLESTLTQKPAEI